MRTSRRLVLLLSALALGAPRALLAQGRPAFVVIVNAANPVTGVSRRFLADAFFKKITRWANDDLIGPVDQIPNSAARGRFSDEILKRSVAAVKSYWQQVVFSGRDVPPPELASEEEVVKFVMKHAGAVGYVSGGAKVEGVKIVTVQ